MKNVEVNQWSLEHFALKDRNKINAGFQSETQTLSVVSNQNTNNTETRESIPHT